MSALRVVGSNPTIFGLTHFLHCASQRDNLVQTSLMNRHIREQHGHEGIKKVFQCAQCEDSFSRKEHLNQHFASNHEEKTCLVCEARLPDKKELRLHMRAVHKEEKTYDCNMCDANFSGKSHLIPNYKLGSNT